jgi:hypothetical protein
MTTRVTTPAVQSKTGLLDLGRRARPIVFAVLQGLVIDDEGPLHKAFVRVKGMRRVAAAFVEPSFCLISVQQEIRVRILQYIMNRTWIR